jgi:MOSC domain-containing protein YiiM
MAEVIAVCAAGEHRFSKQPRDAITLQAGHGVAGDAHNGVTVKHRSRVAVDPTQPNLRQVHLIHAELFDDLAAKGFAVAPGDLGENITTTGVDLLALPTGTRLSFDAGACVELTGLRNPCGQIDGFQKGLMSAVLRKNADGSIDRLAGVMAIVLTEGEVLPGSRIAVELPPQPHRPLERV